MSHQDYSCVTSVCVKGDPTSAQCFCPIFKSLTHVFLSILLFFQPAFVDDSPLSVISLSLCLCVPEINSVKSSTVYFILQAFVEKFFSLSFPLLLSDPPIVQQLKRTFKYFKDYRQVSGIRHAKLKVMHSCTVLLLNEIRIKILQYLTFKLQVKMLY